MAAVSPFSSLLLFFYLPFVLKWRCTLVDENSSRNFKVDLWEEPWRHYWVQQPSGSVHLIAEPDKHSIWNGNSQVVSICSWHPHWFDCILREINIHIVKKNLETSKKDGGKNFGKCPTVREKESPRIEAMKSRRWIQALSNLHLSWMPIESAKNCQRCWQRILWESPHLLSGVNKLDISLDRSTEWLMAGLMRMTP